MPRWPVTPEIDDMLTIDPPPALRIAGIATFMPRNVPVALIPMTAGAPHYSQETSSDQARRAGVVEVLMKPVDKDELVAAVDRAIRATTLVKDHSI